MSFHHGYSLLALLLCALLAPAQLMADRGTTVRIDDLLGSSSPDPLGKGQSDSASYSTNQLGLDSLLSLALHHSPAIEITRQQLAQRYGQLTQARAGYLPQVTLRSRYGYTEREDGGNRDDLETGDLVQGSADLSQLLYDFGKTTGAISASIARVDAAEAAVVRQLQDICHQVKLAYYNILEKQRLIDVAQESVKSFTQHQERADQYYQAGMFTKLDVVKAEVELSNARMELLRAKSNLLTARAALEQVIGIRPYAGRYSIRRDQVTVESVEESMPPLPSSLDTLLENGLANRPDLIRFSQLTEAARAETDSVRGHYWPTIAAEANYTESSSDISSYDDSWEVGVSATWEIFSGNRTDGALAESQASLLENRSKHNELQLTITREVTESFIRATQYHQGVSIALETVELANLEVQLADKRYALGEYDVIEFNDAQLNLTRARAELVASYYAYLAELATIEYVTGALDSEVLSKIVKTGATPASESR